MQQDDPATAPCELTVTELTDAFERVAENAGCAGVDDVTVEDFSRRQDRELQRLALSVRQGRYRPLPLRKIVVEKAPGSAKMRRLLVPAVRDRVAQTAVARRLSRSFEEEFLDVSFAYRPGRGVDRAVARILQLRDRGFEYVVDGDITQFFDRVDHSRLLRGLAGEEVSLEYFPLLEKWVRAEVWDGARVRRLVRGVPQGSPVSPLLANFFLGDFDRELSKEAGSAEYHLVRYADDFLLLCATAEAAEEGLRRTRELLAGLGLSLHPEKTRVTHFHQGFLFLGVYFFGNRAWIPWKHADSRGSGANQGDLLFCAKPMPLRLLARYEERVGDEDADGVATTTAPPGSEMELAFRRLGPGVAHQLGRRPDIDSKDKGRLRAVAYLYVTEQGSVVRKAGDRYLVECGERVVLDLPYHKLECVLLFGRVQVTTQALTEMLDRGIRLALFTRQGRYRGSVVPVRRPQVELRLAQFRLHEDGERSLGFARATVRAKVANSLAVLDRYKERAGKAGVPEGFAARREAVEATLAQLDGEGAHAGLETLLGYEGSAAKAYFQALMGFNKSGLVWEGRVRRPPKDPLNALLSLTYTLLLQELGGAAEALGLDPHVGFLHRIDDGRPSLALDLLEPFRSVAADRLVLSLVNRGVLGASDFIELPGSGAVHLRQESMRTFLGHYERWMLHRRTAAAAAATAAGGPVAGEGGGGGSGLSLRELLWAEARAFAAVLSGGGRGGEASEAAGEKKVWKPYAAWESSAEVAGDGDGEEEEATGSSCNTSSLTI